jgi:glycine dehydrogenase subunit 2
MKTNSRLRRYQAASWDEPVVFELGHAGRRGITFPALDGEPGAPIGTLDRLPAAIRRSTPPALPELSEPEVLRHYLHLAQMTLGMMGISLFGTCTMKYNAPVAESLALRPEVTETHPYQDESTLQGTLAILHGFDLILRELSGMDQFTFQPGGGADAAYTHCCVTRAYFAARGELAQRDEIVTTIQAHPCNAATAAAAGFKVITLLLEDNGYPSLDALRAAIGPRTAAVMLNNPDDMGVYNPDIVEWVRLVHEAGGLAFYDHANFNGVMGRIRARELGFDACMFMLHKTFGAPKGGGGPAVGAYGCSQDLARFLPGPIVRKDGESYRLDHGDAKATGKVREFWGNVPQVLKAYAWARAMGADGIREAADLSVIGNNYMEKRLLEIEGVSKSHPHLSKHRLEMTRMSLAGLKEKTGVGTLDVQNRMVDFGVDAYWLSHEPWIVPEPFTPEAGEMYGKEDLDYWIDTIAHIAAEARSEPERVKSAPHNQAIAQLKPDWLEDPERWAMTWRAFVRKHRSKDVS